ADYFQAAHRFRQRDKLGRADASLSTFASEAGLNPRYMALVWSGLTEGEAEIGPLAAVRSLWQDLPNKPAEVRSACERMRDLVLRLRKPLKPDVPKLSVGGISAGSQPIVLWRNRELASR